MGKWLRFAMVLICLQSGQLRAQETGDENLDLNLIPESVATAGSGQVREKDSRLNGKAYMENALTGWLNRGLLVPVPDKIAKLAEPFQPGSGLQLAIG